MEPLPDARGRFERHWQRSDNSRTKTTRLACRLGWFVEKRMQQYLVLCAGVEHEDEINPTLLEFRATRQQLEDGAFVFPACNFLKDRLGRGADAANQWTPS